ncbi:MAG: hypothetical protein LLF98_09195 [Clostridium sp.]|uniref:hypothetical protein n=1 Tax=Clostridium sp. TaxID=1506 RepID=UPI0025C5DEAF|nr:hypothetical protein [Clostridium sp.]MCE5221418.1 hypothetical protein [Clostridium sp.]
MYLKKRATVLISTVIILSLISMLGCFLYKMMKNNNEMAALYKFDKDIYDFDKDEEEILNEFMKELNKNRADKLSNQDKEDIFSESFENKIEDNSLEYDKNKDNFFLTTHKDRQKKIKRKREIIYILRDEKIILVPTYKFEKIPNKNI